MLIEWILSYLVLWIYLVSFFWNTIKLSSLSTSTFQFPNHAIFLSQSIFILTLPIWKCNIPFLPWKWKTTLSKTIIARRIQKNLFIIGISLFCYSRLITQWYVKKLSYMNGKRICFRLFGWLQIAIAHRWRTLALPLYINQLAFIIYNV